MFQCQRMPQHLCVGSLSFLSNENQQSTKKGEHKIFNYQQAKRDFSRLKFMRIQSQQYTFVRKAKPVQSHCYQLSDLEEAAKN